jgi:hypothetical protein
VRPAEKVGQAQQANDAGEAEKAPGEQEYPTQDI